MHKLHKYFNKIHKKTAIPLIFAVFFVFVDILLKNAASSLKSHHIKILGDFFSFSYAENTGIAFSIPVPTHLLTLLIGVIILLLLGYFVRETINKKQGYSAPLTFIIIGAIMNFIDRLRFGYVIDYFDLRWFTIFNIADCMIVFGAGFFVYKQIKEEKKDIQDGKKSKRPTTSQRQRGQQKN